MLSIAVGLPHRSRWNKGHHGANHPVKDLTTGKVEIVSMNHSFTVDRATLPEPVVETHVSLFDGTNAGIALKDRPVFSASSTTLKPRPGRRTACTWASSASPARWTAAK